MTIEESMSDNSWQDGHPLRWRILGLMSVCLVVVMLNNVTLNVALPQLSVDLDADNTELQWILDAYALVFGGTLLTMGAIGDRFGRRKALQSGMLIVGVAAAWTAMYANTSEHVIAARAIMGIGAALVMPATLSIVVTVFPRHERAKAIGIWAAMAGIGAPIGLFVGGWAVQNFTWHAVFWINVPIAALCVLSASFMVPETRDKQETALDLIGAVLSIAALGSLLYTIIEAPNHGWTSTTTGQWAGLTVILLVLFIFWERKNEHPMLPMSFFSERGFVTGLLAISLAFYVMFSFMFTQMLHFQLVRGHEPLAAAVRFLPLPFGLMPAAANSDRLVAKFGRRKVVSLGLVLVTLGMILFSTQVAIGTSYWVIASVFFILGLGMGLTMAPSTSLVMDAIPADKAGVGSATNDASREIGGALGIAIGGSVLNEIYRREFTLPAGIDASTLPADPSVSFPAAIRIGESLRELGSPAGQALIDMGREAFITGMTTAAGVSAIISLIAAVLVFMYMPNTDLGKKTEREQHEECEPQTPTSSTLLDSEEE